ncbi:MAG: hypothetical protein FWF97_04115 [Alphaproteobacteria bacterium]|nr:hypothetical protein [Alphaproteobacteria bacterium]
MKRFLSVSVLCALCSALLCGAADAYVLQSSKDLGKDDARNQNVLVQCTTPDGGISNQTCHLRRYVKCSVGADEKRRCNGWQYWKDVRKPATSWPDWRRGAEACCQAKGLR